MLVHEEEIDMINIGCDIEKRNVVFQRVSKSRKN